MAKYFLDLLGNILLHCLYHNKQGSWSECQQNGVFIRSSQTATISHFPFQGTLKILDTTFARQKWRNSISLFVEKLTRKIKIILSYHGARSDTHVRRAKFNHFCSRWLSKEQIRKRCEVGFFCHTALSIVTC